MGLRKLLDSPIAYHRCFVQIAGSVSGAVFLSQVCYWSRRTKRRDGFFYKTDADWCEETGIPARTQDRIRTVLRDKGILIEKLEGIPATVHYKLDEEALITHLSAVPSGMASTCQVAQLSVPSGTTISETTRDYKDREYSAAETAASPLPLKPLPKPTSQKKSKGRWTTSLDRRERQVERSVPQFIDFDEERARRRKEREEREEQERDAMFKRVAAKYAPKVGGPAR